MHGRNANPNFWWGWTLLSSCVGPFCTISLSFGWMSSDTWLVGSVDNAELRMMLVEKLVLLILDYNQSNLVHCFEWSYANCRWTVTRKLVVSQRKLMPVLRTNGNLTFCEETQARTNHSLKPLTRSIPSKKGTAVHIRFRLLL